MTEKKTQELEEVLGRTHLSGYEHYLADNKSSMITESTGFSVYMKSLIAEKNMTQQSVFIHADISERYGYKLLAGEKHTRQRDVILRICYAAKFTLEETQRALRKYGMPELYAKIPRDALLMIMFNERPGDILKVNEILKEKQMEPLRTSGLQE